MKRAAIAFSKLRNEIGLVAIEVNEEKRMVVPKYAKQWKIQEAEKMAKETAKLYKFFKWGDTYIEQESGEHLIMLLKKHYELPIKVITTGKKVKDPKKIDRLKVMDKIEMTEFLQRLRLNGQLRFVMSPPKYMKELEEQIPYFTKHATEAGSIDYYAPGKEPDNMVRALMIACFSVRKILQGDDGLGYYGSIDTSIPDINQDVEQQFFEAFPSSGRPI